MYQGLNRVTEQMLKCDGEMKKHQAETGFHISCEMSKNVIEVL